MKSKKNQRHDGVWLFVLGAIVLFNINLLTFVWFKNTHDCEINKTILASIPATFSKIATYRDDYKADVVAYQKGPKNKIYAIKADEAITLLNALFPNAEVLVTDRQYAIFSNDWFWQCYSPWLQKDIHGKYVYTNKFDCENFAVYACHKLNEIHRWSQKTEAEGIAFGELYYKVDSTMSHAINILLTVEEGQYKYCCYEPQSGNAMVFDKEEREKVIYIRL